MMICQHCLNTEADGGLIDRIIARSSKLQMYLVRVSHLNFEARRTNNIFNIPRLYLDSPEVSLFSSRSTQTLLKPARDVDDISITAD